MAEPVPLTLLTGFLGAGKTTLLNRMLRHPALADTAVLVNEFGDVGIDHLLVERVADDLLLLPSGCLCCAVRGDLMRALRDLLPRVEAGAVRRVVVETTGLADPAPVVQGLMGDISVALRYRLDGIVAVVDAVHGLGEIDAHEPARRQVAMADRIVLSKTDFQPDTAALRARLMSLNPAAPVHVAAAGEIDPALLLDCGLFDATGKIAAVGDWLRAEAYGATGDRHAGISSFCLSYDAPLHWEGIGTCLEMLIGTRGDSLLRVKGILNLVGQDRPVVIHGVQQMFHTPVLLPEWPDGDRTSRIVFITTGLDRDTVASGIAAFEDAARQIEAGKV